MSTGAIAVPIASSATAPEWIELIPAGAVVAGFDGRRWANPDPAAVVAATRAANRPICVDWEHATHERAPKGEEAPAAGWVEELDVRDGAIWGRIDWTPRAACQVRDREYRFISPVFAYERAAPNRIIRIEGVGLTNTPNLDLTALNRVSETGRSPNPSERHFAALFNLRADDFVRKSQGLL